MSSSSAMSENRSCCCQNKNGGCGVNSTSRDSQALAKRDEKHELDLPPWTFAGPSLYACEFPLGGFGAGNVVLAGNGTLQRWSVLNQVQSYSNTFRDNVMPACWFGIECGDGATVLRTNDDSQHSSLPGVKSLTMVGKYPIADINYEMSNKHVEVELEALCPLIPGDVKNSSLPCAIFTFRLQNRTDQPQAIRLLASQQNFVGWDGSSKISHGDTPFWGGNVNTPFVQFSCNDDDNTKMKVLEEGMTLSSNKLTRDHPHYGTLTIAAAMNPIDPTDWAPPTPAVSVLTQAHSEEELWQQFIQGQDTPTGKAKPSTPSPPGTSSCCGVVQSVTISPHGVCNLVYITTWHFPNRTRSQSVGDGPWDHILPQALGNYYSAHWFQDAKAVSVHVADNLNHLVSTTRLYRNVLYQTRIPYELLESAAGRVAVLRCPTMFWSADGIVLGSEGNGCCPLNCTHVYGYTTLMERLLPELAMDMRISDFVRNYDPPGKTSGWCGGVPMRYGTGGWALDGALACIIKTYLLVQQSDPTLEFLPKVWPNVKDQLERIQRFFDDEEGDGVIRKLQQNTYDSCMAGANTFIGSYYITALKAVAQMAKLMKEQELATSCLERAQLSAKNYERICWNESFGYYTADVTKENCANSYGPGCFVDQLCGTGLSSACGFGHVFDPQHEMQARLSVLKHNTVTKPPFQDRQQHLYNGDTGIRVCSYPNGKLGNGMFDENLVSTGFTSPNIAGLLLNGTDKALDGACTLAKNIRRRQDGRNASPWNEPECNLLYSRAMAHWNIYDQACGFRYDSYGGGRVSFDPRFNASNFFCFVILHSGWGQYTQQGTQAKLVKKAKSPMPGLSKGVSTLACLYGDFEIRSLGVNTTAETVFATIDGKSLPVASFCGGVTTFSKPVVIPKDSCLVLKFSSKKSLSFLPSKQKRNVCPNVPPTKPGRVTAFPFVSLVLLIALLLVASYHLCFWII